MIKIVCVGKIKEKFYTDAIKEYQKRISKYTKLEIIEVKDESSGNILEIEKEQIMKYISEKEYIITLEIEGKNMTSLEFSKNIESIQMINPNITFIIGGSYGISDEIKALAKEHISFSKMTFPHQLFRVILLEQIYRAYKIMSNESYHK